MHASPTVPEPQKGSSTRSPFADPAAMQGSTSAGGKVAKWASAKGSVLIDQTVLLLRSLPEPLAGS